MKRCSKLLVVREMKMTKHVFEWWQLKDWLGPSIGENVGCLHNASEIVKWHIHFVKQFDTFLKK